MQPRHKQARIEFAQRWLAMDKSKWQRVIFSDEKKFNLDGPDGFAYYWHDLRQESRMFSKRQNGGDSLMLWGAISLFGLSDLVVCKGNMDSKRYCRVLQRHLLPFAAEMCGERWVFQQDNASIHRSNYTKFWMEQNGVVVMDWPAKSPDLNIIENVWGVLARKVYKNARQFSDVERLLECVVECWNEISDDYLRTLYGSIPARLMDVLLRKGAKTKY